MKNLILTGSCYWCLEAVFKRIKGINEVIPGLYSIADYKFAFTPKDQLESIKISYDEDLISLDSILDVLYITHNPTLIKWDIKDCFYPLCRPAIFFDDDEQKIIIEKRLEQLKTIYTDEVQTKIEKLNMLKFKIATEKDQDYYGKNPKDGYCTSIIDPKIEKLKKEYKSLWNGK